MTESSKRGHNAAKPGTGQSGFQATPPAGRKAPTTPGQPVRAVLPPQQNSQPTPLAATWSAFNRARDNSPQPRPFRNAYAALVLLEQDSDLGATFLVDPAAHTVTLLPEDQIELTEHMASVIIEGDEGDGNTPDWPAGLDYTHRSADNTETELVGTAASWERHLGALVNAGEPFYMQTVQLDLVTGDGDDTTVDDAIDTGFVARTVAHQEQLEATQRAELAARHAGRRERPDYNVEAN